MTFFQLKGWLAFLITRQKSDHCKYSRYSILELLVLNWSESNPYNDILNLFVNLQPTGHVCKLFYSPIAIVCIQSLCNFVSKLKGKLSIVLLVLFYNTVIVLRKITCVEFIESMWMKHSFSFNFISHTGIRQACYSVKWSFHFTSFHIDLRHSNVYSVKWSFHFISIHIAHRISSSLF
jgi:hypothetical protein